MESPEKVEVKYRGVPVWIQYIDESAEKALVYPEGNPEEEKIVSVWDLDER